MNAARTSAPDLTTVGGDALRSHAVLVYVLRHGDAGTKIPDSARDAQRPLSLTGVEQAEGMVRSLAGRPVRRLLASPTARCVQTLGPLAARRGLRVTTTGLLSVNTPELAVRSLLAHPAATEAVLCTHGEVMRPLLAWLRDLDLLLKAEDESDEHLLAKGTALAIEMTTDGRVTVEHCRPAGMGGRLGLARPA